MRVVDGPAEQRAEAKNRLSFDRSLARQVLFHKRRQRARVDQAFPMDEGLSLFHTLLQKNDITLTPSQKEAYQTIKQDVGETQPMKRLTIIE